MFGKHNKINEKKTYENAVEAVDTFFDRISAGTETYPAVLEHLKNNVDTNDQAVEALRFVQHGMRSLAQQTFNFNQNIEQAVRGLEKNSQ
jgi:uncharacterized phage infection (PIP) family protein YhgE